MYDEVNNLIFGCAPFVVRVSQMFTDPEGNFEFDYVMSGVPYSVSATDTSGLSDEATDLILESASGDAFNRQKLLELASSPSVENTLLQTFAVGAVSEAIARAEGLDRALLRDFVPVGSPREGTEVIVALRFRGRGTVAGTVLESDGATPAADAAVNLFPDPDSRELGRGVFSDSAGRFAFFGVPLGTYTIQVQSPARQFRTVAGLLEEPGQVEELEILLSDPATSTTTLAGRVVEEDQQTPHPQGRVFVGRYVEGKFGSVVAIVSTDADGYWIAEGIPVRTYDVVAVSVDGRRKGERREIATSDGGVARVTVSLQGTARVVGRVETSTGQPVSDALVAGGESLVRTDDNGFFTLTGVPTGRQSISAGLERNEAAGIDFPRLGSASLEVLAGLDNFVVVRLRPAGRVVGRVLDVAGDPVPRVNVAIPQPGGFMWTVADANGVYRFENLPLADYTVSAPAPPVFDTDVSGLLNTIKSGGEDEILAAVGEALAIFTGAADPLLNGEGDNFNPLTWGFSKTRLTFDGQTVVADIRYLREGTVSGVVLNGQGVPIGARVRLTGIGPKSNGQPGTIIRGERNSDPALGTFEFPNQALAGSWGLQAASPFYPVVITASGQTSSVDPDAEDVVLQFPAVNEVNGRLSGTVRLPDGSPAGEGVAVKISFGNDYVIRTDTNGFYDTQIKIPAGGYRVEADDPLTGLKGVADVRLLAGVDNLVDVVLLDRGDLMVEVEAADGTVVAGAEVQLEQGSYPRDRYQGVTDSEGKVEFLNIFEGVYAACAQFTAGATRIGGRSGTTVVAQQSNLITVRLQPTGTIEGFFLERDRGAPVPFAQVAVGNLAFTSTDEEGFFRVEDLPLGAYQLVSENPVTGAGARASVSLALNGQVEVVQLIETARGEVSGYVLDSDGSSPVSGATVTLRVSGGLTPPRTVTSGPDGTFSFPGTPAGAFQISAVHPVTGLRGASSAVLPQNVPAFAVDVAIEPLATVSGIVYLPDGSTPADQATVTLSSGPGIVRQSDTDSDGRVFFADLRLGRYTVQARSRSLGTISSAGQTSVTLLEGGSVGEFEINLLGVGSVGGRVFLSDSVTPAFGAEVYLKSIGTLVSRTAVALTDAQGAFSFEDVPVGDYRLRAQFQALGASANGKIGADADADQLDLTLGASGRVAGRLLRADTVTAVSEVDVVILFDSQSGLPGRAVDRTAANGTFSFIGIPVGAFAVEVVMPQVNGIGKAVGTLEVNGEEVDLGEVILDEDDPQVTEVFPLDTAVDVPITTTAEILFSETMDAGRIDPAGIYLRSEEEDRVPASVDLLPATEDGAARLVRITPEIPLRSLQTYEVVVIDGERRDALGSVIGRGPVDLVGRPLVRPFVSSFTTADNDPPELLSLFPADGVIQVDPRSVPRLSFNEPIREAGLDIRLSGPTGDVSGALGVGVNGQVVVFTPEIELEPNTEYVLRVDNVSDLAGNLADNLPYTSSFLTLDTIGPIITELRLADGVQPIAGSLVFVEAVLATAEPDVRVRLTQDLEPIGETVGGPLRLEVRLPESGTTVLRGIATDRFNNDGPLAELAVTVVANQPPEIEFVRINPPTGPVPTGSFFVVDVVASDDVAISQMRAIATGTLEANLNATDSTRLRIQGTISAQAGPNRAVRIFAEATDELGLSSGEQFLEVPVSDATPPIGAADWNGGDAGSFGRAPS
jgi:hypothetical protein